MDFISSFFQWGKTETKVEEKPVTKIREKTKFRFRRPKAKNTTEVIVESNDKGSAEE